ncbi:hypothetical protein L207DRAFT_552894 [Hyaloscypha variabilis F]|uniref:Uncharacterized protein n=1 Tax=Hyaloscypha variabilis (strain UAMH 11265 / GT02V1 / F) TaxID=1149755 RepID=A0A2J6RWU3_HYAVF|nr:hypothetical protein L207DRAFT_552894 [Hyaloscypha variabilis F]
MSHIIVLFSLLAIASAYTTFETTCTHPSTPINYVSSVDARGTMDILWSCLFTILACTWTVLHLNVPEQREDRDPGWKGNIKWMIKRGLTSTTWMLITIAAPEVLISKYIGDLASAKADLQKMKKFADDDEVPWTLSHAFLANMGGFAVRWWVPKPPNTPMLMHLVTEDIFDLRRNGCLPRLPYLSPEELDDHNKSDSLIRVIAIIQIVWSVIQILARAARHLAISQLEIAVLAFAACAVVMYGLNWYKPKGVQVPITILQYRDNGPNSMQATIHSTKGRKSGGLRDLFLSLTLGLFDKQSLGGAIPNLSVIGNNESLEALGLALGCLVFGGIHLAAWNFQFPTKVEQVLWWVASLWCTFSILILFALGVVYHYIDIHVQIISLIIGIIILSLPIVYILARLYLLVEIFRTLCFLPESAFVATKLSWGAAGWVAFPPFRLHLCELPVMLLYEDPRSSLVFS